MHCRQTGCSAVFLSATLLCLILSIPQPALSADPVLDFIVTADSLARTGGDDLLSPYISERSILAGAAVGRLLDIAFQVGSNGDAKGEAENIDFAARVARIYKRQTGSRALVELVETYSGWTPGQRRIRENASALEKEAVASRGSRKYDESVRLFTQAMGLYKQIDDRRSQAVAWGSLGVVHWYRGDFDAVIENYNNALTARKEIEDRILEGKTLNGLGSAYFQKGDYETAADFYNRAVILRRKTGDADGLVKSLTYSGNAYTRLGKLVNARRSLEEALGVIEPAGNNERRCDLQSSIAYLYSEMGRMRSANESYTKAIALAGDTGDLLREASYRLNLSDNLRKAGRFREALSQIDSASTILAGEPDAVKTALMHRNRGLTYMLMGELDRAKDDLVAFLNETKDLDNRSYNAEALINIGYLYRELAVFDLGLESARRAEAMAGELGDARMQREAAALSADLERHLGLYEKSLEDWQKALERDRSDGFESLVIEDMLGQANTYSQMGSFDDARNIYKSVGSKMSTSESTGDNWILHFGIGHTYERDNPDSAFHHYEKAFDLMEKTGAAVGGDEILTGFLSGERRYYYEEVARFYAEQSLKSNENRWKELAFRTIERAKARGLLELLEKSVLQESSPEEEELLDSLFILQAGPPENKDKLRRLEKKYIDARQSRLDKTFARTESGSSSSVSAGIVGLRDVQKTLPRNTTLVEYALGDTVSLLWVIDRKKSWLFEIPRRSVLRSEVRLLRNALSNPGAGDAALRASCKKLYKMILEPAQNTFSGSSRLIIIPDGALFEVPFEILLFGDSDPNAAWKDLPYLARVFTTVYAPSCSVYMRLKKTKKKKYKRELLAVGNPDFSTLAPPPAGGGAVAALPFTETEIEGISRFFKEKKRCALTGRDANETRVRKEIETYPTRILHLATHGIADPAEPSASRIYLCRVPDENNPGEDGYLHSLEIMSMRISAGLVVLSQCESAGGRVGRGEGVVGLGRAFIASGAGGDVASLWRVSDKATEKLMILFYEKMAGKKKKACEALNSARLSMLDDTEYAHPFYWAPFIVIGSEKSPW